MTSFSVTSTPFSDVSTHMPLARHDAKRANTRMAALVSTHMPLARHDKFANLLLQEQDEFLLTCLLRGMTEHRCHKNPGVIGVSTHMPLARHDACVFLRPLRCRVSTHMPLARHDMLFVLLNIY